MKKGIVVSIMCTVFFIGVFVSGALAAMAGGGPAWEENTDRPGMDYKQMKVFTIQECQNACKNDQQCKAFTLVKTTNLQDSPTSKCMLKNGVPAKKSDKCCVSGLKTSAQASNPFQDQKSQQEMPKLTEKTPTIRDVSQQIPVQKVGPIINESGNIIRPCPQKVFVTGNTPINLPPMPGFIINPIAQNLPSEFDLFWGGKDGDKKCTCTYVAKQIQGQIRADITGYTDCDFRESDKSILLYNEKGTTVLPCPPEVIYNETIKITLPPMPGFISMTFGQAPSEFALFWGGKDGDKKCTCTYVAKYIQGRILADMTGYTDCDFRESDKSILLYK